MPFAPEFDDLYHLAIKAACLEVGVECQRVDEQIFHETILNQITSQIAGADLIIAETTGRNANVFYEIGYSHALGKRVLLLTSDPDDIPFDLKAYPHIVYGKSVRGLKQQLVEKIPGFLAAPVAKPDVAAAAREGTRPRPEASSSIDTNDPRLEAWGLSFRVVKKSTRYWTFTWKVTVHNRSRGSALVEAKINLLDADGHSLFKDSHKPDFEIQPNQQRDISNNRLVPIELATKVSSASAVVISE